MQAIGSREYKLMLKAARFNSGDYQVMESARLQWADPGGIRYLTPLPCRNPVPGPTPRSMTRTAYVYAGDS